MNLVGKIFTVVIFLMCIVFASFTLMTHAAHKIWRNEIFKPGGYAERIDKANKQIDDLQKELTLERNARANDATRATVRIAKAENQWKNANDRCVKAEDTVVHLEHDIRSMVAEVKSVNANLEARVAEIETVRSENAVAVTDRQKVFDQLVHTQDESANAKAEVARLQRTNSEVAAINIKLKQLLDYVKAREADMQKDPPTGSEGEVTAVPRQDVVEISLGFDDGIRKGHKFSVVRPSTQKYIGEIEVIQVNFPNRAVCRPDKTMARDQIQKGDKVYASLTKRR